jgi:hypothetical protein
MEVDGSTKALAAAEAAGGVFDPLDFGVACLGDRVGDGPTTPIQEQGEPAVHRPCGVNMAYLGGEVSGPGLGRKS